ncbi:MAG: YkgJ family cysteine cluster protein [Clostridiales bacterium]|nr:YkgJ family cysteine cluster protein [Clostridiales bacterium]
MEITKNALNESNKLVKINNLISNLETIYSKIPSGECNGCAKCCMESVHAFYIEFLNIYDYVTKNDLLENVMEKVEDHYFNELVEVKPCPFLKEDKTCLIYPVRPLVCRLFGHATKEVHESNYAHILEQNKAADDYFFENYGVHLNDEVVFHKIEYCEQFYCEKPINENKKNEMIDDMFMIDTQFLMEDILSENMLNMSITNWFIYTKYAEEEASEKRISHLTNGK